MLHTGCNDSDENLTVWNATVVTQLELAQFIENVTAYTDRKNTTNCVYLSLAGENNYKLDIVKLMQISINGSLIMESIDGSANVNCIIDVNCTSDVNCTADVNCTVDVNCTLSGATLYY